jgi:hypothetical protein
MCLYLYISELNWNRLLKCTVVVSVSFLWTCLEINKRKQKQKKKKQVPTCVMVMFHSTLDNHNVVRFLLHFIIFHFFLCPIKGVPIYYFTFWVLYIYQHYTPLPAYYIIPNSSLQVPRRKNTHTHNFWWMHYKIDILWINNFNDMWKMFIASLKFSKKKIPILKPTRLTLLTNEFLFWLGMIS